MSIFDDPVATPDEAMAAHDRRVADIENALHTGQVPSAIRARLEAARAGRQPWLATLTPAELRVVRSHGLKPIASVSATCWMHYGQSWTEGHAQGWETALYRLREEAKAAGANAVLDVKMRTVPLGIEDSMDFTLVGTAVYVDGLKPSTNPIVATVPALEFVKLLEANVVATGIAIGAQYDFLADWRGNASQSWAGNVESGPLTQLLESVRRRAHAQLRKSAAGQGNGVLAHINFGQMFAFQGQNQPLQYLARHIVIATTVDTPAVTPRLTMPWGDPPWGASPRKPAMPHEVTMMIDLHAGGTALTGRTRHHQSYAPRKTAGAI